MISSSASVEIARPAAEVFPYLIEPARLLLWVEGLRESRPLSEGAPRLGHRLRQVMEEAGRRVEVDLEVAAIDRDRFLELRFEAREFEGTSRYRLEEHRGRTRLDLATETRLKGALRLMAPLLRGTIQERLEAGLARLKRAVEMV